MRGISLIATLAATLTACTHTHHVRHGELPATRVDRATGAAQGLLIGGLGGATLGTVIGLAKGDDGACSSDVTFCGHLEAGDKAKLGAAGLGALGAVGGLVVGALVGSRDVYVRDREWVPLVTASAAPGRAGATASWSF